MSFPHTRGDGPSPSASRALLELFSPHAWGWAANEAGSNPAVVVFPTRVGM